MAQIDPERQEELALLAEVIGERPGAWDRFYRRYQRLIIACVRKVLTRYGVVPSTSDVEDLLNTVCLQLIRDNYEKLRRYDADKGYRLSSWVGLISTNAAHDSLRRRGPQMHSIDEDASPLSQLAAANASPDEQTLLKQRQQALNQAVARLSPSEQLFLRYYYLEQRTPAEIAELLQISINTVYSRKNKVRSRLKQALVLDC